MALKGLQQAVAGMKLINTKAAGILGEKAFMFSLPGFEVQNPFKHDLERRAWRNGWEGKAAQYRVQNPRAREGR
jgi:hypothetical protein